MKLVSIVLRKTRFSSELQVRPDDLDMNQHVHASRYFDYVLAARYEQMARCYKMSMEEFLSMGLGWFVRTFHIEYKRPLGLGEWMVVTTWVEEIAADSVRVDFEISKRSNRKLATEGYGVYTLVNLKSGWAETIPEAVLEKYSI
jgi:acyl-CoA thioester hydrolase/thioesterase-3